ncbi:hypothetical protein LOC68_18105 [Blastopirellula sp. JC732]|uniref:Rhamnogalacturonan lyase domain-containing protein n=1 Tax=Blastopirellula sediminis TaxID=2894196 RepID=A0A9X1SHN8_9BACT|nr:hypothetical protein [Blastopirellula sediminis]MCC9606390.1 hypothetical protein [Blastopirellula sediminis]MCC9630312.1 hypothetical protein [Blastopirellula sediminis]
MPKERAIRTPALLLTLSLILFASSAAHAQWGSLTGKFVVKGMTPPPLRLKVDKDVEVCGKKPIFAETLLVGPNGELKNVAVWITPARGKSAPEPHPNYLQLANVPINVDNLACVYTPHMEVIWTKRPVHFRNQDPIAHNFSVTGFNTTFNVLVPPDGAHVQTFEKEEKSPIPAACTIHPWMKAQLLVRDSPYAAASDDNGAFTIADLPAGKWEFSFWHEAGGYLKNLKIGDEKTDRKGVCEITIEPGKMTDLGQIVIDAGDLK